MFNKNTFVLVITLLLFISAANIYAGGDKRNGTGGAQELLLPVGARSLALGGSNVAALTGIDALNYNPAGLGVTKSSAEAMFSHMTYIADIGLSYAALSVNFEGFGSIGFNVKTLDFGDIPITTVETPEGTGSTFSPSFVTVGLTYANAITDRIRVGITANLISEKIVNTTASGMAFTAGVQYNGIAAVEGLKMGVVLKNIGPQMKYSGPDLLRKALDETSMRGQQFYTIDAASFELPSQLELGLAYEKAFADDFKGLISTSFENNNFSNDEYKLGGEIAYKNVLFLRGGYVYSRETASKSEQKLFDATYGAGVNLDAGVNITVDYAYRNVQYFGANHMITVKLGF